jgi:hypothetical protein
MVAQQLPLVAPAHNNQQLFSDHYLDHTLPRRGDWQLFAATIGPLMARIAALYAAFTPSSNEAQTESDLVRPILAALGHTFEVQAALRTPDGTKKPDYVFYRDRAALDANKDATLTEERLRSGGLAVGDAKYWDRPLDVTIKATGGDPFTNKNPAYQIAFYIQHSGLAWGILTNGRLWRLYHRDTAHKLDRFYEVDLPALLADNDPARFLYFAAFFGRDAFEDDPLGVAALLKESADYAQGVGNTLKAQVYEALRHLAQGFLDHPQNHLASDPATLKAIYDNALIVLYRLLFILYAEARELLPVRERAMYRDSYSLYAITRDIASSVRLNKLLLSGTATLWPRLQTLFGIINEGSPPLKVATFNGGLFDPARHPFLERYTVGDARLQAAIDKLARVKDEFVDYRDLAERHLGTIYEGLLEFHLTAIPREGEWTLALLNDRGERKATGSYYTPDYIVKYIVERTIGPVLRAAVASKETDAEKIAAVLGVNVLDPAMGSGHFPVEATAYIARFLIDLAVTPAADAGGETDLAYWKRRVAQNCIYGVDLNPLAVDLAKLSLWLATVAKDRPLSFLDHHLRTGNALVGARLADLQIGAQDTTTRKRPGKRVQRAAAAGQLSMLDDDTFRQSMGSAVSSMWRIEGTAGDTIAEVKAQERAYAQLRDDLNRKYGRLADLVSATHFGVTIDAALWTPLADFATGRTIAAPARFTEWLDAADRLADERRFFHYELEFPEVYFDRNGQALGEQAGFDAVIGNPPYVRQEQMAPFKPYFASEYRDTYHGVADLYVYFFDQGLRQLRQGGRLSYICSNSWLQTNFAQPLRRFVRTTARVETLIDLGNNRTFSEAPDVCPTIFIFEKETPQPSHRFTSVVFQRGEAPNLDVATLSSKAISIAQDDQPDEGWQLEEDENRLIFAKLMKKGRPLSEVVDGQMYRGVSTGLNEAFIIDTATRDFLVQSEPISTKIIKPLVRGEDLRPWYQEDGGKWLIFPRRGIDIEAYPAIKAHLEQFREQLEPRPTGWQGIGSWPGRKPGSYKWYEIQDSVDYYNEFDKPKVFWPDIAKIPRFSFAPAGVYIGNTGYLIPIDDTFLLGFLGSRVAWMILSKICLHNKFRGGLWEYRVLPQFISRLPIPDAPTDERESIGALTLAITEQACARYDLHSRIRRRILTDLGTPSKVLNQKLTAWWTLDFSAFRAELLKVFKRDIALKERDDWEAWLAEQRAAHQRHTAEIVRLETELNSRVYTLFDLTPAEITLIEESTKYRYGEV